MERVLRHLAIILIVVGIVNALSAPSTSSYRAPCTTKGGNGTCINTSTDSCTNGALFPGYCSGPSNIVCCVGGSAAPPLSYGASISAVVTFANAQWDCGDPSCSYTVSAGTAQPNYACAEFVARSLAAGGFIPLSPYAPQSSYLSYNGYDLAWVGSLYDYLTANGWTAVSAAQAGYVVMGDAGDGDMSHTCIGVGPDLLDCHNNARQDESVSWIFINGVDYILAPPGGGGSSNGGSNTGGSNTGGGSSGGGSSGGGSSGGGSSGGGSSGGGSSGGGSSGGGSSGGGSSGGGSSGGGSTGTYQTTLALVNAFPTGSSPKRQRRN